MALLAASALTACRREPKPGNDAPGSAPAPEASAHVAPLDSAAIAAIAREDYASLLQRLARAKTVESEAIGYGGMPSETAAIAAALFAKATPEQRRSLLRHESPIVRCYAARHALRASPDDAPALAPLLRDNTKIDRLDGCIGGHVTVAWLVLDEVCSRSTDRAPRELLLSIARADHPARGRALECVARVAPAETIAVARGLLGERDPALVSSAVRALGEASAVGAAGDIAALATHEDEHVRAAVARALGELGAPAGVPALAALARDRVVWVRRVAGEAYVAQPGIDPTVVAALLRDEAPMVHSMVVAVLSEHVTPETLPLLAAYLEANPKESRAVPSVPKNAAARDTVALLRKLAGEGQDSGVRRAATRYLLEAGERPDPVALRRALKNSRDVHEQIGAAEALAEIGDVANAPALEEMLKEGNPHARIAAAKALVKLRAARSQAALDAAAAADTSWAAPEMRELAAALAQHRGSTPSRSGR